MVRWVLGEAVSELCEDFQLDEKEAPLQTVWLHPLP